MCVGCFCVLIIGVLFDMIVGAVMTNIKATIEMALFNVGPVLFGHIWRDYASDVGHRPFQFCDIYISSTSAGRRAAGRAILLSSLALRLRGRSNVRAAVFRKISGDRIRSMSPVSAAGITRHEALEAGCMQQIAGT